MYSTKQKILNGDYGEFINFIKNAIKNGIPKKGFNIVCYCVGYFGYIDDRLMDMLIKAYGDGFFD